jgi:Uma2 family endonuclease
VNHIHGGEMSANPNPIVTVEEYLKLDESSPTKYEYIDGYVVAMAPPSLNYVRITANLLFHLRSKLAGRDCEVYASDLRVLVEAADSRYYPDVVVICGEPQVVKESGDSIVNPIILIEVLSPNNAFIDTGKKMIHYKQIPSLKEYLLVPQNSYVIGHHIKQDDDRWDYGEYSGISETVRLHSINVTIPIRDIYDKVVF